MKYLSSVLALIFSFLAGSLLGLGGYGYFIVCWIAYSIPIYLGESNSVGKSFWIGFLFKFGTVVVGFPWINYLAENFIGVPFPFHHISFLVYAAQVGLMTGIVLSVSALIKKRKGLSVYCTFPVLHVAMWSVYPMLFNFRLGESQLDFYYATQPVEFTGVYGLDLIILMFNALIVYLMLNWKGQGILRNLSIFWRKPDPIISVYAAVVFLWFLTGIGLYYYRDSQLNDSRTVRTGIVQPNRRAGEFSMSWAKDFTPDLLWEVNATKKLIKDGAELILWPEGNNYNFDRRQNFQKYMKEMVSDSGASLMLIDIRKDKRTGYTYNSAFFLTPEKDVQVYDKNILVPFGEYIPLVDTFRPLMDMMGIRFGGFRAGEKSVVFQNSTLGILPLICYETLFGSYVAETAARDGGDIILAGSQDGWYDSSQQVYMHMGITKMRAVETRKPLVHAVQNGYSEAVDMLGRSLGQSPYKEMTTYYFDVPVSNSETTTFYSRYPYFFISILYTLSLLIIFYGIFFNRRKI